MPGEAEKAAEVISNQTNEVNLPEIVEDLEKLT
jgi:hypothetical protein